MNWYEYLIIVAAALFVVGVIVWRIVRKVQGKGGCDCGGNCSGCGGCSTCRENRPRKEEKSKRLQ